MSTSKKNPFIEGFKEPTLSKNSHLILADVRGDGEGKLIIWSEEQSQLIVYKGTNREYQKEIKLKNVSGIIQYQDEERNPQAVIALSAENGLYIFRSLSESFRLKVPDVMAEPEQQIIWSQYEKEPEKMSAQLMKINKTLLSESAKYFLSSTTLERKQQIIGKVFTDGINEKDSISAMTVLKASDLMTVGNVVLGTELNRLYILDSYGHTILNERIIEFAPSIILAHGSFTQKYVIICIGREGEICLYLQNDLNEPSQRIKSHSKIVSASLSFPDFLTVSADQVISHHNLSNSDFKFLVKKYSMKLGTQPINVQFLKVKGQKMTIVVFENQFRLYNDRELHYTYYTDNKLYKIIWGSFARQQCCLILLYQNAGFQVLILSRQFNIKEKYGSNKVIKQDIENIPIPKKTSHFLQDWNDDSDQSLSYKLYEKSIKLLKWRTLRERFEEKGKQSLKMQVNTKILGLGPNFIILIEVENLSEQILFEISLILNYDKEKIEVISYSKEIRMLTPFTPCEQQIQIRSITGKNQQLTLQYFWAGEIVSSLVCIPNCEEFLID